MTCADRVQVWSRVCVCVCVFDFIFIISSSSNHHHAHHPSCCSKLGRMSMQSIYIKNYRKRYIRDGFNSLSITIISWLTVRHTNQWPIEWERSSRRCTHICVCVCVWVFCCWTLLVFFALHFPFYFNYHPAWLTIFPDCFNLSFSPRKRPLSLIGHTRTHCSDPNWLVNQWLMTSAL